MLSFVALFGLFPRSDYSHMILLWAGASCHVETANFGKYPRGASEVMPMGPMVCSEKSSSVSRARQGLQLLSQGSRLRMELADMLSGPLPVHQDSRRCSGRSFWGLSCSWRWIVFTMQSTVPDKTPSTPKLLPNRFSKQYFRSCNPLHDKKSVLSLMYFSARKSLFAGLILAEIYTWKT